MPPAAAALDKMIDLGAGDGKVTSVFKDFFNELFATETSKPMQKLLSARNMTVVPVDAWTYQHVMSQSTGPV